MVTLILTLTMRALLFLMIWAATYFYPWEGLLRFFPKDIEEKARLHKPPFPAAPVIGWILMLLCALGCAGYHSFGYNRKEQLTRILTLPFAALLTVWVCTLF